MRGVRVEVVASRSQCERLVARCVRVARERSVPALSGVLPYNTIMSARASERVEFRVPAELKEELEAASAMLGLTTSAFVKQAALQAARKTVSEERQIVLGAEAWQKFTDAVDKPGEVNEGLAELLRRPSVFTAE